jgi:nucleotidyltransferase substrate binding protein (TIGR01987 family)
MEKPRWQYRFDNYGRAFALLRKAMELRDERPLSDLEKIGTIQCFECTWELAWKTLKDYMESQGLFPETATPVATVKTAFEAGVIQNGDIWMSALADRNRMAHTYDIKAFEETIASIYTHYMEMFGTFYAQCAQKIMEQRQHG